MTKVDYSELSPREKSKELDKQARQAVLKFGLADYSEGLARVLAASPELEPESEPPTSTRTPADRYNESEKATMAAVDAAVKEHIFNNFGTSYEDALSAVLEDDPKLAEKYWSAQ